MVLFPQIFDSGKKKIKSSNAVQTVDDDAIKLTKHELRSTLDNHYWKQQKHKVVYTADKVVESFIFKKKLIIYRYYEFK